MGIVGRELEMPFQLSGVGVESDQGVGVKIVAIALVADHIRRRVACSPVHQVGFRVISAGDPSGSAAGLPAIARPGFVAGLARRRHRVEAPGSRTGLYIVSVQEAADTVFGAGYADDDFIFQHERRGGNRVGGLVIGYFHVPTDTSGPHVQRDQVRIHRAQEELVIQNR